MTSTGMTFRTGKHGIPGAGWAEHASTKGRKWGVPGHLSPCLQERLHGVAPFEDGMPQIPWAGGLWEGVRGAGPACGLGNAEVGGPQEMLS